MEVAATASQLPVTRATADLKQHEGTSKRKKRDEFFGESNEDYVWLRGGNEERNGQMDMLCERKGKNEDAVTKDTSNQENSKKGNKMNGISCNRQRGPYDSALTRKRCGGKSDREDDALIKG